MGFKKLEIRGFKSLGSRTTVVNLEEGFTAITGPNGSGKSNLFDAILFCLGQNSPKQLRVDRLASLIFDGGAEGKRSATARVTLTFDNVSRLIPVDSDAVTVSRDLKADGESTYYLNGRRIQKGSLSEVLGVALVGPEGLHIIPQGVVTRISELTPDEKRRMLEELVGVAQFDQRKSEALKQLHDADVQLQVAMARIGEIKSRVDHLEEERNDQLRLRQLESLIGSLKAVTSAKEVGATRARIQQESKGIESLTQQLSSRGLDLERTSNRMAEAENERRALVSGLMAEGGEKNYQLQQALVETAAEVDRLHKEATSAEEAISKGGVELSALELSTAQTAKGIEEARVEIGRQRALLKDLEGQRRTEERAVTKISSSLSKLDVELARMALQGQTLGTRTSKLKDLGIMTQAGIESITSSISLTEERLKSLGEKSTSYSEVLNRLEASLQELKGMRRMEEASVEKLASSLEALSQRRKSLEEELQKASDVMGRASTAVVRFESQRSIAQKVAHEEAGLERLRELTDAGAIGGFLGTLEDLIEFDRRYENPITAGGRRWMKAAVVKDLQSMLRLFEGVKRLKVPRIGIIPASEVSSTPTTRKPPMRGVISTICDLITCADEVRGVVNFVFGGTLLVDSPRSAYLASSEGYRAVTPAGDLFEPRGSAFETGYTARMDEILTLVRGGESFNTVKEAVGSLQKIIARRKEGLTDLEKQWSQLEKERVQRGLVVERLEAELTSTAEFAKRHRQLLKSIEIQRTRLGRTLERLRRSLGRLNLEKEKRQKKIESLEKRMAGVPMSQASEARSGLEGSRMHKLSTLDELSSRIRDQTTLLTRLNSNLLLNLLPSLEMLRAKRKEVQDTVRRSRTILRDGAALLSKQEARLAKLKQEESKVLESARQSKPRIEELEDRIEALGKEREAVRREMLALEKDILSKRKSVEYLQETERRLLRELELGGYSELPEVFQGAERVLDLLSQEYESLRRNVNLLADRGYREVYSGYRNLSLRRNQLEAERVSIVKFIEGIDSEKTKIFMATFGKIDRELASVFRSLTGGEAKFEIEKPDEIFSGGIFLMTQFPGKLWRESSSVSGGEKTVTALSLVLAIQSVYPSPFYLFDEIDAHLDAIYTERLSNLLRERSSKSQIIIVTLKDTMVSKADCIYGIYMKDGISNVLKYKPGIPVVMKNVQ